MKTKIKNILYFALIISFIQGCAGTRYSYTSLLEKSDEGSVLSIKKGATAEILAVGDGFPGSWGYYPWVISSSQNVASIDCKEARSYIPFREPGVILGGVVCNLIAHEEGKTILFFGNRYNLSNDNYEEKVNVIVKKQ